MKYAIIMRGLTGSGKSTLASKIADNIPARIHSTDDYHMIGGKYVFQPHKLTQYHDDNFAAYCDSLLTFEGLVIVDNTNITPLEYMRYIEAAHDMGWDVIMVSFPMMSTCLHVERSSHDVPAAVIKTHALSYRLRVDADVEHQFICYNNDKIVDRIQELINEQDQDVALMCHAWERIVSDYHT